MAILPTVGSPHAVIARLGAVLNACGAGCGAHVRFLQTHTAWLTRGPS